MILEENAGDRMAVIPPIVLEKCEICTVICLYIVLSDLGLILLSSI